MSRIPPERLTSRLIVLFVIQAAFLNTTIIFGVVTWILQTSRGEVTPPFSFPLHYVFTGLAPILAGVGHVLAMRGLVPGGWSWTGNRLVPNGKTTPETSGEYMNRAQRNVILGSGLCEAVSIFGFVVGVLNLHLVFAVGLLAFGAVALLALVPHILTVARTTRMLIAAESHLA